MGSFRTPRQRSPPPGYPPYSSARSWHASSVGAGRNTPTYTTRAEQLEQSLALEREKAQQLKEKLKTVSKAAEEDRANFMSLVKDMKRRKGESAE